MKPQVGFLFVVALAFAPVRLAAQDGLVSAPIDSGTLIRMHPASGRAVRGRLVQPLTPSSTIVTFCRYPASPCTTRSDSVAFGQLPVNSLARLDVQKGTKWATGAVIGGLIGGLFGVFMAGLADTCDGSTCNDWGVGYVAVGAVSVGALGALFGSGFPKWEPVP